MRYVKFFIVSVFVYYASFFAQIAFANDNIICEFTADKYEINSPSDIVTLKWDVENAETVYINNGLGYQNKQGRIAITGFSSDIVYTLTASNKDKIKECSVRIKYKGSKNNHNFNPNYPKPYCFIEVIPKEVYPGGSALLRWNSYNASSAELKGYGSVPVNGSKVITSIHDTKEFKLEVKGKGGVASCKTIIYKADSSILGNAPSCELNAIGKKILNYGESTTLQWKTKKATEAILSLFGPVQLKGEITIKPEKTQEYIMQVKDRSGRVGFCSITIEVKNTPAINGIQNTLTGVASGVSQMSNLHPQNYGVNTPISFNYAQTSNYIPLNALPYTGAPAHVAVGLYTFLVIASLLLSRSLFKRI